MNMETFGAEFLNEVEAAISGGCPAKWMDLNGHLYYGCHQVE